MSDDHYLSQKLPPDPRNRGRLLTLWLVFFLAANSFAVVRELQTANYLSVAWAVFGIAAGISTWLWYKVGFYGMLLGYGYSIAANIDAGLLNGVMFSLVFMGLTFALVRSKWEYFR
jgi:hypothetical protein